MASLRSRGSWSYTYSRTSSGLAVALVRQDVLAALGSVPCISVVRSGELCAGESGRVGFVLSSGCGDDSGVWKVAGDGGAGVGQTGVRRGAGWPGGI